MIDFDPHSHSYSLPHSLPDDPYPADRELRDLNPVLQVEELGFWAVSRHDDVMAALLQPQRCSSMRSLDGRTLREALGSELCPGHTWTCSRPSSRTASSGAPSSATGIGVSTMGRALFDPEGKEKGGEGWPGTTWRARTSFSEMSE